MSEGGQCDLQRPEVGESLPRSSPRAERSPRLEFLDGMRALAALTVLVHHARLQVWPESPGGPSSLSLYLGHLSVNVFIVISGFCLMLPVLRGGGRLSGGLRRFFKKRARRILPPYYCALALSLVLVWLFIGEKTGTHWDVSVPATTNGIIAHVLLLQDVLHRGEINHAFWSIAVEWQIYFLFPLLVVLWARIGALPTASLALGASILAYFTLRGTLLLGLTPHYVGLFALGMLGATIALGDGHMPQRARRLPWPLIGGLLLILSTVLVALGWGLRLSQPRAVFLDVIVGLLTLSLLVTAATTPAGRLRRVFSAKPLAAIGVFSYSLYLIHAPLLQLAWQYGLRGSALGDGLTFLVLVGLGCPAIVGASYLFFVLCERPFLNPATPSRVTSGRSRTMKVRRTGAGELLQDCVASERAGIGLAPRGMVS